MLDNKHILEFVMKPCPDYGEILSQKEQKRLEDMISKLTSDEKKQIFDDGIKLAAQQELKQGIEILIEI